MNISTLNYAAIFVAALSGFALGGLWYSPVLFANAWMKDSDLTTEKVAAGSKAKIFGFTALFLLIMAFNLSMFLADDKTDMAWGATAGFLAGIWTFSAIAIHSLFELKAGG